MSVVMNRQNFGGSDTATVSSTTVKYRPQLSSTSTYYPSPPNQPQHTERTKTLKNCCRIFVELMFTQVKPKYYYSAENKILADNNEIYAEICVCYVELANVFLFKLKLTF